jgi:hypothetical protein
LKQYFKIYKWLQQNIRIAFENKFLQIYLFSACSTVFFHNFLLFTGFISDDAYNSQILGALLINKQSLIDRFVAETAGWFTGAGRFFPLHWYFYFIYYFTQSEILVKSITLVVMMLGLFFFSLLIEKITKSKMAVLLCCISVPAIFQVRAWHDPILAFTFLLPLLFLYLSSSLYYFQCFLESGRKKYLIASVVLHLFGLLTYEANYLFFLCHISLAFFSTGTLKEKFKKVLPILIVSFGIILIAILAKTGVNPYFDKNTYPGASIHLNPELTIKAFLYHCVAGIPLSYFLSVNPALAPLLAWEQIGIFVFFMIVLFSLKRQKTVLYSQFQFLILGSSLFFPPAIIMALSGHQEELVQAGLGYGYLPVYFQYFGFYLIFISGFSFFRNKIEKCSSRLGTPNQVRLDKVVVFIGALFLSYVAATHLMQNKAVANSTNSIYLFPRKILGTAIQDGILNQIGNESLILQYKRFPSDQDWFLSTAAKRPLKICDSPAIKSTYLMDVEISKLENLGQIQKDKFNPICGLKQLFGVDYSPLAVENKPSMNKVDMGARDSWVIAYSVDVAHGVQGIVIVAKIDEVIIDSGKIDVIQLNVGSQLRVYEYQHKKMTELSIPRGSVDFLKLIEDGLPLSLHEVNFSQYKPGTVLSKWYGKVHPLEGTVKENLRWSSGDAELVLYNLSETTANVELRAEFKIPGNKIEKSLLKIIDASKVQELTMGANSYFFERKKSLVPGVTSIEFSSDGKVFSSDSRNIVFGIFNFKILEATKKQGL